MPQQRNLRVSSPNTTAEKKQLGGLHNPDCKP